MSNPTRRTFLKETTMAAGVVATSFTSKTIGARQSKVRVGIIGSTGKGDYGHAIDVAFTKMPNVEIVALADENASGRAAAIKRTNPKKSYADYREMLSQEKLDVVAICPRWIDQHYDMTVAAAQAGCHVYIEKPFCPTLLDCDRAINELGQRGLKLGMANISQYSPVLEVVRSIIENGDIGDVLELRGRGKEDHRGGGEDLWVLGSHIFGLMRTLAGGNATNCSAIVLNKGHRVTKADVVVGAEGLGLLAGDNVQAAYSFPGGTTGFFASRRGAAGNPTRFAIQVFGTKGIVELESGYLVKGQILRDSSWSPGRTGKSWEPITSAGIGKPEKRTDGTYEGGHIAAITDLLESIQSDRPTKCSAVDGRSIVEMIASVFESHRLGRPVDLPLISRDNPLTMLT